MNTKNLDREFLTIKEFADFVGMTVPALRHYDKLGIFVPAKHGNELENNYRYYSPTQITAVKMIRVLAEIDVPLKTIKALTQSRTPDKMIKLLCKNKAKLYDEIHFLQEAYAVVCTFIDLMHEGISAIEDEITVAEMPEKRIVLGDITDQADKIGVMGEYVRFCGEQHKHKLIASYPVGGYWESMAAFSDEPSHPMRFFSLDPKGQDQKAAGLYLISYTRGYYGQTNDLPRRMEEFAKKNGLVFSGPVYNLYLFDEISMTDPNQYLLQVSASVIETRRVPSRRSHHRI
jgi:DNA-binding transcriptional MerR regulator